jgi:Tfp pilus assembly protein PilX
MRTRKPFNAKPANTEDGFAIPIALGFGLIMILLATTSLIRSQNDNISAINKRSTARSLAAAETGVARIQDFLNRNREAATAQFCAAAPTTYGNCPDSGTTVSWNVRANIPNCPNAFSTANPNDVTLISGNNWQNVSTSTPADASQGEFRIVSYTTGGVLTVEGRANVGTSGEAKSKVAATLPVTYPTDGWVAALWAKGTITGPLTVNSNVVINETIPCGTTVPSITFPVSGTKLLKTTYSMPAPQAKPTTKITTTITTTPPTALTNTISYYELTSIASVPGQQLPRTSTFPPSPGTPYGFNDQPGSDGVYRYIVPTIDASFKIKPGEKVRVWVTGDINLSNKIIANQCNATGSNPLTCGPFDVRIYPQATGGTPTLTLDKGTAVCDVFFHLPDYAVTFNNTGTVTTQDCGTSTKNTGVYWIKSWDGAGTVIDPPRAIWDTAISATSLTASTSPIRPVIGPVSGWDRQSF